MELHIYPNSATVQLIHQSAKDFIMQQGSFELLTPLDIKQKPITFQELKNLCSSQLVLTCLRYLSLKNSDNTSVKSSLSICYMERNQSAMEHMNGYPMQYSSDYESDEPEGGSSSDSDDEKTDKAQFLAYAAKHWHDHIREIDRLDDALWDAFCEWLHFPQQRKVMFQKQMAGKENDCYLSITALHLASADSLTHFVSRLLYRGADVNATDGKG